VVAFHDAYNSVFMGLKAESEALFAELTTLGADLEARSATYNSQVAKLSADIQSFNSRANAGNFSSMAQFNRERAALVARSNQLEADRQSINKDIATYNTKYQQYQQLAIQIESLNKSIDSLSDLQAAPEL
jgi:predicted  nucleic acid-binding Zn-ribbon protein